MRSGTRGEVKDTNATAEPGAQASVSKREVEIEAGQGGDVEVDITCVRPTEAEKKAIEDFFDWLFAESQRRSRSGNGRA